MARRRPTRSITVVTIVAAALALLPGAGSASATPAARARSGDHRSDLVRELLSRTRGQARIAHDQRSGRVTFIGAGDARVVTRPADVPATGSADAAARAYLRHLAPLTGVGEQTVRSARVLDQPWGSTVHYQQTSGGVPVFGGDVTVSLDRSHQLTAYSANTSDTTVDTTPRVTADAAASTATASQARRLHLRPSDLRATAPVLSVYDSRLLGTPGPRTQALVWRTEVTAAGRPDVRELVLVDADRGTVALHFSEVDQDASPQTVCDFNEVRQASVDCTSNVVPDPSTAGGDAQKAYENALATDTFYRSVLGRAGIDGNNLPILSTVQYCPTAGACPYDNAFWNGRQMVYGQDLPGALDVVGHELTHGVTQYTSGLLYYYQSGAINESLSDVMGELVDQLEGTVAPADRWMIGQDVPADARNLHDLRNMQDPTFVHVANPSSMPPQPDSMTSTYWFSGATGDGVVDAGGVHENSGVGNKAAYLIAEGTHLEPGTAFNGHSFTGMTDNAGLDVTAAGVDRNQVLEKVANLYYTVQRMLPMSATYADLANLLPQACNALVAVSPVTRPGGSFTFNNADCTAVQHAVDATQMSQAPVVPGAAARPAAAMCVNGGQPKVTWSDDFEDPTASAGKWRTASTSPLAAERNWFTAPPEYGIYPHQGRGNMWGDDPKGNSTNTAVLTTATLRYQSGGDAFVPTVNTYLWFAHSYAFDEFDEYDEYGNPTGNHYTDDGGRVEYTTDPNASLTNETGWVDAGPLMEANGYTGVVDASNSALQAKEAFVGTSAGYTATRLNLGSLAGKSVRLRFAIGASGYSYGSYGWYVDDVKLYTCNATTLSVTKPLTVAYGGAATVSGALTVAGTTSWINGAPVLLYQRAHGTSAWGSPVRVSTTSYHGNYSFTGLRPTRNEDYLVKFNDSAPYAHTWSATTVWVAPTVSVKASSTSFTLGHTVTLSGTVSPNHAGQYVYLQRYLGSGKWTTVTSKVLSSTSTYSMAWKPTLRAAYVLRVVKNADADHVGAASSNVTIHVS
ncbi:M4 family metallopeptidase [Oryzihumus sp.]|uniref:M4 family metallopeptidase n=1 Tax=Oryzihumus sp. TaxID=1968903 RepID=UPI002EDA695C